MARFSIGDQVFQSLPGACFGAVVASGIHNNREYPEITRLLANEVQALHARLEGVAIKEHEGILPYREAFLALGMNPNKFMCSVEALYKRVQKGAALPSINPIVDLGNALSLKYCLPMGAHDIDKLTGDLEVRPAGEGDRFRPFGETETETPEPGELVYVSGNTVKTRRWIWRQSEDGKIDENSTHVIFPIDGFAERNLASVQAAQQELKGLLESVFGARVTTGLLTADSPAIQL